ncbi:MAG: DNA recombination protein RecN, partial [Sulfurovum sp.]|nr:DNA recombination protein RecN [Sulfurovum sp.]
DRLGELTELKWRYGSIEAALENLEAKRKELDGFRHMEQDKSMLEQFLQVEQAELQILATKLSAARKRKAYALEERLASLLVSLKLPAARFVFSVEALTDTGADHVEIVLGDSSLQTLSGGEFNRLRLALMAAAMPATKSMRGVLILDEIDANVSGDESIAIAEMIAALAKGYQVFAISHQPHLAAKATQHILVSKDENESSATVLDEAGRIAEISRIIAGEDPTEQAVAFAKKLRA